MFERTLMAIVFLLLTAPLPTRADDATTLPPVQTSGGVSYMTGGVGTEEREAMSEATRDYGLKLVFADKRQADFLADITVSIAAANGTPMMEATNTGPYVFVKLPPGRYEITATSHDQALKQRASVSAGTQTNAAFYW